MIKVLEYAALALAALTMCMLALAILEQRLAHIDMLAGV